MVALLQSAIHARAKRVRRITPKSTVFIAHFIPANGHGTCHRHGDGDQHPGGNQLSRHLPGELCSRHRCHFGRDPRRQLHLHRLERCLFRNVGLQHLHDGSGDRFCGIFPYYVPVDRSPARLWHGNGYEQPGGDYLSRHLRCRVFRGLRCHAHCNGWDELCFQRLEWWMFGHIHLCRRHDHGRNRHCGV